MLTPSELLHISDGAEQISEELHNEIIRRIIERIMIRLDRGDDYILTPVDKWQLEVLRDAGFLYEDIQKEIAKATRLQEKELKAAFEDAGVSSFEYDAEVYKAAGITTVPLKESPQFIRLLQRGYEATLGEWKNYTRTTAEEAYKLYIRECDKAYNLVASGAVSRTEAVRNAVNIISEDGVYVTYPSGHRDTIETAEARALRTGVSQYTAQTTLASMKESGFDEVIISSHLGARPDHAEWQGKIFSVDWETVNYTAYRKKGEPPPKVRRKRYPDLVESTRYTYVDGLCGANCRHSMRPYFEGMANPFKDYDSEENRKKYEIEQKQRMLERRIRATKREVMGKRRALDMASDGTREAMERDYQRKAALLRKQNKEYSEYCKDNNLKELQDRLFIAKWDRAEAAKANGAATKWENRKK